MCWTLRTQKPLAVDPLWLGMDSKQPSAPGGQDPGPLDCPKHLLHGAPLSRCPLWAWGPTNGLGVEVGSPQDTWVSMLGPEATSCLHSGLVSGSSSRGPGSVSGLGFPVNLPLCMDLLVLFQCSHYSGL